MARSGVVWAVGAGAVPGAGRHVRAARPPVRPHAHGAALRHHRGRAVQVEPIGLMETVPGTKRLKL